eukprot:scaffold188_cov336-Pavlova_lutheri.AAC.5
MACRILLICSLKAACSGLMLPLKGRCSTSVDAYAPSPYKATSSSRSRLITRKRSCTFDRL